MASRAFDEQRRIAPFGPAAAGEAAIVEPEDSDSKATAAACESSPETDRGEAVRGLSPRQKLREALLVYAAVSLALLALSSLTRVWAGASDYLYLGFPALFLLVPTFIVSRRNDDYGAYGLVATPYRKNLAYFAALSALVFPLFIGGYALFYRLVCAGVAAGHDAIPAFYRAVCARFDGSWAIGRLRLDWAFVDRAAGQLIQTALPEEYFFRGYLQTRLEQVWPARWRVAGGGIGKALVVTSLLFALGHVIVDFRPLRLAVFFPSLLFGWLRSATGSIGAAVLFHACCNILIDVLNQLFFAR